MLQCAPENQSSATISSVGLFHRLPSVAFLAHRSYPNSKPCFVATFAAVGYTKSCCGSCSFSIFFPVRTARIFRPPAKTLHLPSKKSKIRKSHAQAHLSTQPPPSQQSSWIPRSHGHQGRRSRPEPPPCQGPSQNRRLRRLPRLVLFRLL